MRWRYMLAALGGGCLSASAQAAVTTTTTSTFNCALVECTLYSGNAGSLAPFDSSLGALVNVILRVEASASTYFYPYFVGYPAGSPTQQTGSAEFAYTGPLTVTVNGIAYSVTVSGEESYSYTGYGGNLFSSDYFSTAGTGTFVLDHSLLASFVDQTNTCTIGLVQIAPGICVTGPSQGPNINQVVTSTDNLGFAVSPITGPAFSYANYTLTYVYAPGIPEPGTWAMMLLGFTAIGFAVRRNQAGAAIQLN